MKRNLLMLGAGLEQCIAINEAHALGYRVIACDANPQAPGLELAETGIVCDIKDVEKLVAIGREHEVAGVFCHAVEIPEVIAQVAQQLGLPGLPPEVARRCTDKQQRIAALTAAGIPVAAFQAAASLAELQVIAADFGYPLVLKPVDNAGSRGVRIVAKPEDLPAAYDEAMQYTRDPRVLVEQVLQGPQVSTESVVYQGQIITFAFADRNYQDPEFYAPYFIENGINFPSTLSDSDQQAILQLVEQTIEALGIDFGAAKGDIILHQGKPYIIEMACRTSGGWFGAGSIPKATGINALRPLLQMAMGDTPELGYLTPRYQLGCAQRYWIPREAAVFHRAQGVEQINAMPGVEMFDAFFPAAGTRLDKARHHAQRYAQVICTAETRDGAIQRAEEAIAAIDVEMTRL